MLLANPSFSCASADLLWANNSAAVYNDNILSSNSHKSVSAIKGAIFLTPVNLSVLLLVAGIGHTSNWVGFSWIFQDFPVFSRFYRFNILSGFSWIFYIF